MGLYIKRPKSEQGIPAPGQRMLTGEARVELIEQDLGNPDLTPDQVMSLQDELLDARGSQGIPAPPANRPSSQFGRTIDKIISRALHP